MRGSSKLAIVKTIMSIPRGCLRPWLLFVTMVILAPTHTKAQECDEGTAAFFEKTTLHELSSGPDTVRPTPLDTRGLDAGITAVCSKACLDRGSADCPAFVLDYETSKCFSLDRNTQGIEDFLKPARGVLNYFEKVCLERDLTRACRNRIWAFETVPGFAIVEGYAHQMLKRITSRKDCEELCLRDGTCRAAEYDAILTTCSLTRYDRRRTPESVEPSRNSQKEYLENQCNFDLSDCTYEPQEGRQVAFVDAVTSANSADECRSKCDRHSDFNCRSFTYVSESRQCLLSAEDSSSAGSAAFSEARGRTFNQKRCERVPNGGNNGNGDGDGENGGNTGGGTDPTRPSGPSTPRPTRPNGSPSPKGEENGRPTRPIRPTRPTRPGTNRPGSVKPTRPQTDKCQSRGGDEEYEKTVGYRVRAAGARGVVPYVLHRSRDPGITGVCVNECRNSPDCVAFFVDYKTGECYGIDDKSAIRLERDENSAFFEGVCLRGGGCRKYWAFQRLMDFEMTGTPMEHVRTRNREECMEECQDLRCGSATFDERSGDCILFKDTRYTNPRALRRRPGFHYLENQCVTDRYDRRSYKRPESDTAFSIVTKSVPARSQDACMDACDQETSFTCRSFTFLLESGSSDGCLLSGDQAHPDLEGALSRQAGAFYVERVLAGAGRDDFGPDFGPGGGFRPDLGPIPPDRNCIGRSAYERTFGHDLLAAGNVYREPIRTRTTRGIIVECLEACTRLGPRICGAVVVQTRIDLEQRCFALSRAAAPDGRDLVEAGDTVYFQPMCMSDRVAPCSGSWVIDRTLGFELQGVNDRVIRVGKREDCANACLETPDCKSATFVPFDGECRLSKESRRTKPQAYRPNRNTEYLENQCVREESCSEYSQFPGRYLPLGDKFEYGVRDIDDCRQACDSTTEFNCRSFNYMERLSECSLSADDSLTIGSNEILSPSRDHIYGEKGACQNVRVECTPNAMVVTVEFPDPFTGLIWAMGGGQDCQQYGEGRSSVTLEIPLGKLPCGTVQDRVDMFVNHVTIQRHNVITQAGDRMVRVECSYAIEDRTVTYAPQLEGIDMRMTIHPTGADRVTNTAPAPGVRLRIVDAARGVDVTETTLGDPLVFTLEIDPAADFGMFATNVEAFNEHGHRLGLIDSSGCPVNEAIFPALQEDRVTRKNLVGQFEAFSFPASQVVNFIATVNFCQRRCEPARCTSRSGFGRDMESWGRKKRSAENATIFSTTITSTEMTLTADVNVSEDQVAPKSTTALSSEVDDNWKSSGKMLGGASTNGSGAELPLAFLIKKTREAALGSKTAGTASSSPSEASNASSNATDSNNVMPGDMSMSIKLIVRDQPLKDTKFTEGLKLAPGANGTARGAKSTPRLQSGPSPFLKQAAIPDEENKAVVQQVPYFEQYPNQFLDNRIDNAGDPQGNWLFYKYPGLRDGGYSPNALPADNQMCSSTGTVVAAVLSVVMIHLGIIAGFMYFYKQRKKQWKGGSSGGPSGDWAFGRFGTTPVPTGLLSPVSQPPSFTAGSEQVLYRSLYDLPGAHRQMSGSVPCLVTGMAPVLQQQQLAGEYHVPLSSRVASCLELNDKSP